MNKIKHQIIEKILLKFPSISRTFYKFSMRNRLGKFLKDFQLINKINCVYDIGAFKGQWSNFYKNTSLSHCNFILFEANKDHIKTLKKTGFQFFNVTLSDQNRTVKFYNNNNSTGDSYYKENTHNHKNLKPKEIFAYQLDYVVKQNKLVTPELIKIDTQGSEIDILKGSKETLKQCNFIYLECPMSNFNKNKLNFQNYIDYLNKIGFIPQEICEIHHYHQFLVQVDILFIRKSFCIKNNFNINLLESLFN